MKVSEFYLTLAWTGSATDEGRGRLVQRGSITVQLTSYLFCVDSAALPMLNEQQFYLLGQIKTSQIAGQQYSDSSPYKSKGVWLKHQQGVRQMKGDEGLCKWEVSLCSWPPIYFVWIQLLYPCWMKNSCTFWSNSNQSNRRSAEQCYRPIWWVFLAPEGICGKLLQYSMISYSSNPLGLVHT